MGTLTQKQEAFCVAYLETGNASEAYRRVYSIGDMKPASINRKAKELLDNGKIAARMDELRKPAIEAAQITLEGHLSRLEALSAAAEQERQYSAAIAAEVSRGKAAGFYVDRKEVRTGPLDDIPHEDKLQALAAVRAAIAKAKA